MECCGLSGLSWKTTPLLGGYLQPAAGEDGGSGAGEREHVILSAWESHIESILAPTGLRGPAPPLAAPG